MKIAKIKQRRRKQNSGITLIALVVTIVVLIILAVISINVVFSENGIIRRAEKTRDYQANAEKSDEEALDTLDDAMLDKILQTQLNPNRSISLSLAGNPTSLKYGDSVTLVATLSGYENLEYTIKWQYSTDNVNWYDCGVTGETMTVVVTPENASYYWNVLVTITGLK